MKRTLTETRGTAAARRSRWPVLFGALALAWAAWWYCREGSQGLFIITAVLGAVATAFPRALPGNTRWVVWTWVAVTVVCLAANVERIVPPEKAIEESRALDRLITAAFAVGVTALLFRPGAFAVTLVTAGSLPMIMLVLGRSVSSAGAAAGLEGWIMWTFVALAACQDQAQRLTSPRAAAAAPLPRRDVPVRGLALAAVVALAFVARAPIERGALILQKRLFGLVFNPRGHPTRQRRELTLGHSGAKGFERRMGIVMLVSADSLPGYFRESVYSAYGKGRWAAPETGAALKPVASAGADTDRNTYSLTGSATGLTSAVWRVEVTAPGQLTGLCAPGTAAALTCGGPAPLADTNGMLTAVHEAFPAAYDLQVIPRRLLESAFPLPDGAADASYLAVTPLLESAVSNWVAACAGLSDTRSAAEAVKRVEDHFATNFTYRLGTRFKPVPDPLVDFMRRREGSCTHFASAGALMFRRCGLPSRVVSGYVCCEWSPWLKRWVIREREGHAWVEVWDAARRRWLLADPTPPDGRPSAHARPGKLRMAFDLVAAGWSRFLRGLKSVNPLAAIADAGGLVLLFAWHAVWSPAGAVALAGLAVIVWLRRRMRRRGRTPQEQVRAEMLAALRSLARRAVPERLGRRSFESWSAWLRRVEPDIAAEDFQMLSGLTEQYQTLRYRQQVDAAAARQWLDRADKALREKGSRKKGPRASA